MMNEDVTDEVGIDLGKKHKLGHLRVDSQGNATFKRLPTNQLVEALQLGIQYSVGGLEARQAHDVLFQDFLAVEIIHFPKGGRSNPKATPPHRFNDFTIRSYAPVAFRHFREKFNIKPADYLSSLCKPFRELTNPGASGSLFYLTADDEFIIKTVQKKEAEFLKTLLPGYYMNIIQNQRTLLPKFFGLYCYQGDNKNIRITVMNNLIPSHVQMHEKYDLKGSTYKRRANSQEQQKESPTWKDLDFMERHPYGLILDSETYNALAKTVQRDCRVLESFHIMDYSFLIGVHRIERSLDSPGDESVPFNFGNDPLSPQPKRMMYSTPMDNIHAEFDENNKPDGYLAKTGGIPARTIDGQKLSLYVGIIDILQSYQLRKKLEHTLKSVVTDGNQISVTNPNYYSDRFQKFLFTTVFKKATQEKSTKVNGHTESRSSATTSNITTPVINMLPHPFQNMKYEIPGHANYAGSVSSTDTSNSRITSYYASLRSSRESKDKSKDGSSTTIYASSHQSDSLYNEPTRKKPAKILTTSFNNRMDNLKLGNYQESSKIPYNNTEKHEILLPIGNGVVGKLASSTSTLNYRTNALEYSSTRRQPNHQSSDEITRF
ncbi:unnamed protein product [Adineta steineri]|uniref:PIPK domain-containing protein n=1 Tax=Adineta steineri TaxID=433720 RepID=A0A819NP19_9BILA|nr:unnamed protein product [Adineta steineri]CAF3517604.1 unnamed protein product [Adineta steineri]CAF4000908.1 unnamed protein product [Adineta steineri]